MLSGRVLFREDIIYSVYKVCPSWLKYYSCILLRYIDRATTLPLKYKHCFMVQSTPLLTYSKPSGRQDIVHHYTPILTTKCTLYYELYYSAVNNLTLYIFKGYIFYYFFISDFFLCVYACVSVCSWVSIPVVVVVVAEVVFVGCRFLEFCFVSDVFF